TRRAFVDGRRGLGGSLGRGLGSGVRLGGRCRFRIAGRLGFGRGVLGGGRRLSTSFRLGGPSRLSGGFSSRLGGGFSRYLGGRISPRLSGCLRFGRWRNLARCFGRSRGVGLGVGGPRLGGGLGPVSASDLRGLAKDRA